MTKTLGDIAFAANDLPDDAPIIIEGMGALWGYVFDIHAMYDADGKALVIQVSGHKSCAGTLQR